MGCKSKYGVKFKNEFQKYRMRKKERDVEERAGVKNRARHGKSHGI